jgi:hypothetical protein
MMNDEGKTGRAEARKSGRAEKAEDKKRRREEEKKKRKKKNNQWKSV